MESFNQVAFLRSYLKSQNWSFPDSTIYYVTKNPPSPELYLKLIKCCKHFFVQHPNLVIPHLTNFNENWLNEKTADFTNITSKLWITDEISATNDFLSSSVISKIFKCDVKKITLWKHNFCLNDFMFLTSNCEICYFTAVTITDKDGSIFPFEKLLDVLPNVTEFKYRFLEDNPKIVTSKTAEELFKISHFLNLSHFEMENTPEILDIERFWRCIKENKAPRIYLAFDRTISAQYKSRLQMIIDEIFETENHSHRVPMIELPGMETSLFLNLLDLFGV